MNPSNGDISQVLKKVVEPHVSSTKFEHVWQQTKANRNVFSNVTKKKLALAAVLLIVVMPASGFAYYKAFWANANVKIDQSQNDLANMKTPLETFENFSTLLPGTHKKSLAEARGMANFPIRVPNEIVGWTRVQSIGLIQPMMNNTNIDGHGTRKETPLFYLDLYTNEYGQRIVVMQRFSEDMTDSLQNTIKLTYDFPKGSEVLQGFGNDLAILQDLKKGRKDLVIFHKESNNKVTQFDIYGTTNVSDLKMIANDYLGAPSS